MTILSHDIKLIASQVMDDVPEGGGSPSGVEILDGASNALFHDISELDRAGGRVNLRKVFAAVATDNTDHYFGANLILAEPPADPRVSVTLFSTRDDFDRRTAARNRIESYLAAGGEWGGYLFENHIQGQRAIQLFQRPNAELPPVGRTLLLIVDEGKPTQYAQYVRITHVSAVERTFTEQHGSTYIDYPARVVTCEISDALRYDFPGSPASRSYDRIRDNTSRTAVKDTVVADAAKYYGVTALTGTASLGDFSADVDSIFTALVPSAQTETPIVDARPHGDAPIYSASGGAQTFTTDGAWNSATSIAIGAAALPGSITVQAPGATVTDRAGRLMAGTQEVGLADYQNGILRITDPAVSYDGTKSVTYTPAAAPVRALHSASWAVTPESRSSTVVTFVDPPPAPGSVAVHFMAQGQWYVLRDGGDGVLLGMDAAYGAGQVNYATGSVLVTLGALPDIGSKIIMTYGLPTTEKRRDGAPLVLSQTLQLEHGGITPGTLVLEWVAPAGVARVAIDDGFGVLEGDASGTVNYLTGAVEFAPNVLPPGGAEVSAVYQWGEPLEEHYIAPERNPDGSITIELAHPNILPGTVEVEWNTEYDPEDIGRDRIWTNTVWTPRPVVMIDPIVTVRDNGAGALNRVGGSLDYATGTLIFKPETTIGMPRPRWANTQLGTESVTTAGGAVATTTTFHTHFAGVDYVPIPAYFVEGLNAYVKVRYRAAAAGNAAAQNFTFVPGADITDGYNEAIVPGSVALQVAGQTYIDRQGTLFTNIDRQTGAGQAAGTINYTTGRAEFSVWPEGASNGGTVAGLLTSLARMPVDGLTFRTASAPLRPGSFVVQFVALDDEAQQTVIVTANTDGSLSGTRVAGQIDAATGVATLRFGEFVTAAGNESEPWFVPAAVRDDGTVWRPRMVFADTLRYAAVAYSYLPLDADLLGLDPVRLPQDGRVPIFRPGEFAVVGHTGTVGPVTVSNGQTVDCGRVRLSRVRVLDADGALVTDGYSHNLDAGTVTFADVSSYAQPVTIEHRIEDMVQVSDVQISGRLAFTRALTHDYPAGSFVSSALVAGDLRARVSLVFDQTTWTNVWADAPIGSSALASYNDVLAPIAVTNLGAVTERWAIRFTSTTSFEVIGEHVGIIAVGNTGTDLAPINPATGTPYFVLQALGWGLGWSAGNVLRFNTVGALAPVWVVRTIAQGPETVQDDAFTLLIRGDVDRP